MLFSELLYLCRCFCATVSVSLYLCHRIFALLLSPPGSLFHSPRPHIPARLSRSPTFGRCAVSPHFLLTFRRCAEAALPLEPPVSAFPHPSYHSHLPKVGRFPTFSTHLPKVRRSRTAPRAACSRISPSIVPFPPSEGGRFPTFSTHLPKVRRSRTAPRAVCSLVFPSTVPFPPSEGGQFPHIFYSPSEGAQKPHCPESRLYPHFPTHRAIPTFRRCAVSLHFLLTF